MEGLRQSLFAPAASSFFLVMGAATAIKEMVKVRYFKDDEGKPLYTHPYRPWIEIDPKYKEQADKAWRAFKMCENVKEWTVFSMPLVWIIALFGSSLPYVEDSYVNYFLGVTSAVYSYANHQYIYGYMEAPEKRIDGFRLRMKVFQAWLSVSLVSLLGYGLIAAGIRSP
eukprot:CAMPEP_0113631008 /NCGR_PEP_ID=MMETSP0017_2-20120614/16114_1 /TAXON_ID=2856 /ORGANISM="Cylindrotheca closterium" /LENGTH=168 /DNA_ID=CAMNT_0000541501 /DNA_START=52 /DNA_END=558 /DNA_ORIENTATION=- /assembly_acc=CAM_ASM_000147